tara:strand:+ start:60891 stop:62726 length:1836 start_codon:yes stop_codon:yes gene_type:complete
MKYNTIVIGGGLAGLVAGATLSKFGKKVLLLEQHHKPGGCATTFKRDDFIMEVGLHEMDGLDDLDSKVTLFKLLEVDKNVQFTQVPELYHLVSKNHELVFPYGTEQVKKVLTNKYPEEEKGITRYLKLISGVRLEMSKLPKKKWKKILITPFMPLFYPNIVEASGHSVGEWFDKHISNEQLKLDLAAHLGYWGDNPYTMSMFYFSMAQSGFIGGGGHFIKGGSQKLSDHLASFIEKNGGTVLLGKKASKINTENNLVTGVTFVDSFNHDLDPVTVNCDNVVANCAIPLVCDMLEEPHASTLEQKIAPLENACSLYCIYLGFKSDLTSVGVNHYSTCMMGDDVKSLKDMHPNNQGDWSNRSFIFVDYDKVDAGLAPAGKTVGAVCTVDYLKDWKDLSPDEYKAKKKMTAETLLQRLEDRFPGIKEKIEYYEVATPKTIERFTLNPDGAVYGYAQTAQQSASGRLRDNFLIRNLYFSSAWAFPGGGFTGAMLGGFLSALNMKEDEKWTSCPDNKIEDERIVSLLGRKEIDANTIELSFEKPASFNHQSGKHSILELIDPKVTELDLPYRWLKIASPPDEPILRFSIPADNSSFDKSCNLMNVGDKAIIFGPMG